MKFIIKYIRLFLIENAFKLSLLFIGGAILYIGLNYIDSSYIYEEKILDRFEISGQEYLVIEDSGMSSGYRTGENTGEYKFTENGSKIKQEGTTGWFIAFCIVGSILMAIGIIVGFTYDSSYDDFDYRWKFKEIYMDCLVKSVKVDREGSNLYYHYKGRILTSVDTGDNSMYNGKGLSVSEIRSILKKFNRAPNLYEKYKGTATKVRQEKINSVIDEKG